MGVGGHGEIGNTTPGGTTTQAVAWSGADRQPPHDAPGGARAGGPSRGGLARVLRRQELRLGRGHGERRGSVLSIACGTARADLGGIPTGAIARCDGRDRRERTRRSRRRRPGDRRSLALHRSGRHPRADRVLRHGVHGARPGGGHRPRPDRPDAWPQRWASTVRTTRCAPGFRPTGSPDASHEPSLVVQVVWKGVGSADLEAHPHAWPFLRATIDQGGGTLEGTTGSLPLDPTATLTTIGTGGLPTQHGITGTIIRGDDGDVAPAWGAGAPGSVIATLADDLDRDTDQRALIAGVLSSRSDRGIIGDGWYRGPPRPRHGRGDSPPGARGGGPPRPAWDPREA